MKSGPRLPVSAGWADSPKVKTFQVGARVRLKSFPVGPPGVVVEVAHRMVKVEWVDLGYIGKHRPDSLALAADRQGHQ